MKKFLKYAGICSLVLAIVAFILMMATKAIVKTDNSDYFVKGTMAIFGGTESLFGALSIKYEGSVMALLAWIFALVALLIVLLGVILPLLKVKALTKFAGLLNLIACVLFVLAGVFMFFVVPTWYAANGLDVPSKVGIGAGWVIGAILYLGAGAAAILPAAMDFAAKK